jgi:methylmalonyl-CoA epimerase
MGFVTLDHLAICVPDAAAAAKQFCDFFGAKLHFLVESEELEVKMAFLTWGDKIITLDQPTTPTSSFAKFLDKRGPGIHHVGVQVENVEEEIRRLEKLGVKVVNTQLTGKKRREGLVLPKDGCGVLWQLIEWREDCKDSLEARLDLSRTGLQIPVGDTFKKTR